MKTELTDDQIRVTIAEACGWKANGNHIIAPNSSHWASITRPIPELWAWLFEHGDIPDYLTSLDAMHEAEKWLTEAQINAYERELAYAMRGSASKPGPGYKLWHATARQRALAFLAIIQPQSPQGAVTGKGEA